MNTDKVIKNFKREGDKEGHHPEFINPEKNTDDIAKKAKEYIELSWCPEHQNKIMIRTDVNRTIKFNCLLCRNEFLEKIIKKQKKEIDKLSHLLKEYEGLYERLVNSSDKRLAKYREHDKKYNKK